MEKEPPLTWIVQVYSESSSSLTVQLHSLSRLLTLLLISRLSIFSIVCKRDQREARAAHRYGSAFCQVNGVPAPCSNTWSVAAIGASFYHQRVSDSYQQRVSSLGQDWRILHLHLLPVMIMMVWLARHPLTTPAQALAMPLAVLLVAE